MKKVSLFFLGIFIISISLAQESALQRQIDDTGSLFYKSTIKMPEKKKEQLYVGVLDWFTYNSINYTSEVLWKRKNEYFRYKGNLKRQIKDNAGTAFDLLFVMQIEIKDGTLLCYVNDLKMMNSEGQDSQRYVETKLLSLKGKPKNPSAERMLLALDEAVSSVYNDLQKSIAKNE